MNTLPVLFVGHGSPMMALEDTKITQELQKLGQQLRKNYPTPKAILSISAHWFTRGTFIQKANPPKQIYDMYGFPKELYDVTYPVAGYAPLTERVQELLGDAVSINDAWGIDHGTWTVLCHMFPEADIPVVQLSVDSTLTTKEQYELGKKLVALRKEGYLIIGSGNIVHNLRLVDWHNEHGTPITERFSTFIAKKVVNKDVEAIIHYEDHPDANYAAPTPDHFLPLVYCLGAADGNDATIFNDSYNMGTISMTSFMFK